MLNTKPTRDDGRREPPAWRFGLSEAVFIGMVVLEATLLLTVLALLLW